MSLIVDVADAEQVEMSAAVGHGGSLFVYISRTVPADVLGKFDNLSVVSVSERTQKGYVIEIGYSVGRWIMLEPDVWHSTGASEISVRKELVQDLLRKKPMPSNPSDLDEVLTMGTIIDANMLLVVNDLAYKLLGSDVLDFPFTKTHADYFDGNISAKGIKKKSLRGDTFWKANEDEINNMLASLAMCITGLGEMCASEMHVLDQRNENKSKFTPHQDKLEDLTAVQKSLIIQPADGIKFVVFFGYSRERRAKKCKLMRYS